MDFTKGQPRPCQGGRLLALQDTMQLKVCAQTEDEGRSAVPLPKKAV